MKKASLLLILFVVVLAGCKKQGLYETTSDKQPEQAQDPALKLAKQYLQSQLSVTDLEQLNWDKATLYKKDNKVKLLALPSKNILEKSLVYLFFEKDSIRGNWVNIEKSNTNKVKLITATSFDRLTIQISEVNDAGLITKLSTFANGRILNTNPAANRTTVLMVPATIQGPDQITLYLIQSLGIGQPNWVVTYSGYEVPEYIEPLSDAYSGGYQVIYVDVLFDYSLSGPAIDLQKYFNCFDQIPSDGATYSVTLNADLPYNADPNIMAVNTTPGHAFITMKKTNGSQSVTQSFGFYPKVGWISIFATAIDSKIVDDGFHEHNASISMNNVSQLDFNSVKTLALNYANTLQYDINNFNCSDYALECFNFIRTNPLIVPDTDLPLVNYGTTPNGIYKKLKEMKDGNHPEAGSIQIGVSAAPISHGPCN